MAGGGSHFACPCLPVIPGDVPVLSGIKAGVGRIERQDRAGLQLPDVLVDGVGRRNVAVAEVEGEDVPADPVCKSRNLPKGTDIRGKGEGIPGKAVVEGLFSDPVPGEGERSGGNVIERNRKHADALFQGLCKAKGLGVL